MARNGKVAVVGAGFYGSTTAQRLAEYDIFDEVVLTDILEGRPEGLALDIVDAFLTAEFEGGRHATRVEMVEALEE